MSPTSVPTPAAPRARRRGRVWHGLEAVVLAALVLEACSGADAADRRLEHEVLKREKAALEQELAADREAYPPDAVVAVPASLVGALLAADLPFETTADRFRITVERADVDFRGAVALVTLGGRVAWVDQEDVVADVEIVGTLDVIGLDEERGSLRARVEILGVRTRDVRVAGLSPPAERLLDALARRPVGELTALVREVRIPVRILRSLELPAVEEDEVSIAAARLPLDVRIHDVRVGEDRLLVVLDVRVPEGGARP